MVLYEVSWKAEKEHFILKWHYQLEIKVLMISFIISKMYNLEGLLNISLETKEFNFRDQHQPSCLKN